MDFSILKDTLPDYARDTKINLGKVLSTEGSPDLTEQQILGVALTTAYWTKDARIAEVLKAAVVDKAGADYVTGIKAAVASMGMTNIYYKFLHLSHHDGVKALPANLRMQVIGNPPIPKLDFELFSLAASILSGCENCIRSHVAELDKAGVTALGLQSTARITAVVKSLHDILAMEQLP